MGQSTDNNNTWESYSDKNSIANTLCWHVYSWSISLSINLRLWISDNSISLKYDKINDQLLLTNLPPLPNPEPRTLCFHQKTTIPAFSQCIIPCAFSPTVNSWCSYVVGPNQSPFSEHGLLISWGITERGFKPILAMAANITNTSITLEVSQDIATLDMMDISHQIHFIEIDTHEGDTTVVSATVDTRLRTEDELI